MSDPATLQHNQAFSPRHYPTTTTSSSTSFNYNSINSSAALSFGPSSTTFHPRASASADQLPAHANGKRRTRRLSTPTEERKVKEQRKRKDSRTHSGASDVDLHSGSTDDIQLHVTTELDADEHQWLLASAAASQRAAAQLTSEAELCPLLIEPQQLIASSDEDQSPQLSTSPTGPARQRVVDLVSSYEQLYFIRFAPRLTSLAVARYVWAAAGLMEMGWLRGHEGETGGVSVWVNVVWGWQACWLVLCLGALVWSVAVEWSYNSSVAEMDRVLLALFWCVSVMAAVLLSHHVMSHRLVGTRLYHLYHNAHPPRSSLPAINRTLYSSLLGLLLLFGIGLYADLSGHPMTRSQYSSAEEDIGGGAVRSSLWYACIGLLRLQLAAGASLAVCLVDVHRQRVEQSRAVLMATNKSDAEDGDVICAHLLDVQLCAADLSDRVGSHLAAIVGASALSALVLTLCAVTTGGDAQLLSILSPLLLASYILLAAARLNQACSRLHTAGAVLALQPPPASNAPPSAIIKSADGSASEGEDGSAVPPRSSIGGGGRAVGSGDYVEQLRAFGWHRVSFDACGVRVDATVLCVFVLFWCGVLLWLMQTEHGR